MIARQTTCQKASSGLRVIMPEVRLPKDPLTRALNVADRDLLDKLLEGPLEYVTHPSFSEEDIENVLYGGPGRLAVGTCYFHESMPVDPARSIISGEGPLTVEQERYLFRRFNYARYRVVQLADSYRGKRMPLARIRELLAWAHRGLMARGQLTQANIALVLAMIKQPTFSTGRDFGEMVSVGNLTLLRSVDRFDCSRGYKFSTYACRAIIRSLQRSLQRQRRYSQRFPLEYDPTHEPGDDTHRRHEEDESYFIDALSRIVEQNRASLDASEMLVLRERFQLGESSAAESGKTLMQVGAVLGVTKERVRQIQNRALKKLKRVLERELRAA